MTTRGGERREVTVTLGDKVERSHRLQPVANPSPLQAVSLKSWIEPMANARGPARSISAAFEVAAVARDSA